MAVWPDTAAATGLVMTARMMNRIPIMVANYTLGAPAASFDFTSLPTHYRSFLLELYGRGDAAGVGEIAVYYRYNNNSSGNYYYMYIFGQNSVMTAGGALTQTAAFAGNVPAATAGANMFGGITLDVVSPVGTITPARDGLTVWHRKTANGANGTQLGYLASFLYVGAAVTRITIYPASGNFVTGSRATLYGLP